MSYQNKWACFLSGMVFLIGGISASVIAAPSTDIPQDLMRLVSQNSGVLLVPESIQKWRDSDFNTRFFSPWHRKKLAFKEGLGYFVGTITAATYYGENKLPIPRTTIAGFVTNMDVAHYPSLFRKAITVANTNLRLAPTGRPFYLSFDLPGEGYPFDYGQETGLSANTPVVATHFSNDRAWVLVETAELAGWVPVQDIAWVTDAQAKLYENQPYVGMIHDQVPVYDPSGQFLWTARVGMMMPVVRETPHFYIVRVVKRSSGGMAIIDRAVVSKSDAGRKPIALTAENLARVGMSLIGQPYGWGDLYGDRDCASMIQDMFVPFGIWLPRNGNDQGRYGGYFVNLKSLAPADKEKMILSNGVPFLTLLWLKGHIMVYVGSQEGRALAFHNIWGIRTRSADGKEGRHLIGKAVITTLTPGQSVPSADSNGDLLKRLEGMAIVMPRFY